jgi:hypothetical protein
MHGKMVYLPKFHQMISELGGDIVALDCIEVDVGMAGQLEGA